VRIIEELLSQNNLLDESTVELLNKINDTEKLYEKYKKDILIMRRNELNRLNKEYLVNDYERRFGVSLEVLISAIAGEDNKNGELIRQQREQKVNNNILIY
jgi:hypothetical protein